MPTYEYECPACGHRFEKFQSITDEPVKKCPECGKKVKRLLGAGAAVIIKGNSAGGTAPCRDLPCCGPESPCGKSCPYER